MDLPAPDPALVTALQAAIEGEARFDDFSRGRYATDASIYQIMPLGVVIPRTTADLRAALEIADDFGLPVTMRGAGTSQNGQPIGPGLIIDCSRHLNRVTAYSREDREISVEPGLVLDELNRRVRPDGLFFPVEPSTATRCTIGGMVGNNSCGARSIRYGKMVDHVLSIDALFFDGEPFSFGSAEDAASERARELARGARALADRHRYEIDLMFPKVMRRVGGYNLDELLAAAPNMAKLLVGSEGTLAATTQVRLKLSPLPEHRVMGVCQFPSLRDAMATTQFLVALDPTAVELVDHSILTLGAQIPLFNEALAQITRGTPNSLLLIEFAGSEHKSLLTKLRQLDACMGDHGFPNAVIEVVEPSRQRKIWELREACLNIVLSMKGDNKPVSFIEDCAVPLEKLADYTDAVTELFARHGTRGTWYAHASVGCLHVRPILNMKAASGVRAMREIAEAVTALVRDFKGSYSGEHGDGISRSEFNETLFGPKLARAFEGVKDSFDPYNRMNPGKIVRAYRMDDRSLMRFAPDYRAQDPAPAALDWTEWGGLSGAVEMCNNNGACRALKAGAMCPSFRVTKDEEHVTRGRANALRLALSGQLGPQALTSPEMKRSFDLCVSCKACRRECPTGVDMARMKVEFLQQYVQAHGLPLRERLFAHLPHYAPIAARIAPLLNARNGSRALARMGERLLGISARRSLPVWKKPWRAPGPVASPSAVVGDGRDVVLFADTFNRYFEPENLTAAERVLTLAGYRLHHPSAATRRPLCCGRTFLSAGLVTQARREAERTLDALLPFVDRGARIVGLEPACLLTFKDEYKSLIPKTKASALGDAVLLFGQLLASDLSSGRATLNFEPRTAQVVHVHGHCHQKAFDALGATETVLKAIPGLDVRMIESSCCGMAGAFGYGKESIGISLAMGELALLPAVRNAAASDLVVADGTSCRHQIRDGTGREALHLSRLLERALIGPHPLE